MDRGAEQNSNLLGNNQQYQNPHNRYGPNRHDVMVKKQLGASHPTGLTENLLRLFTARPLPVPLAPIEKKKCPPLTGIASFLGSFAEPNDPEYAPPAKPIPTLEEKKAQKMAALIEKGKEKVEKELPEYDPDENPNATREPYKTLFVGRLSYETTKEKLKNFFEGYGSVRKVSFVTMVFIYHGMVLVLVSGKCMVSSISFHLCIPLGRLMPILPHFWEMPRIFAKLPSPHSLALDLRKYARAFLRICGRYTAVEAVFYRRPVRLLHIQVEIVHDKTTGKPRGYAFVEFYHTRDMKTAYKSANEVKLDGRRILVDVERGRTVKGWVPRRLGGGAGNGRNPPKERPRDGHGDGNGSDHRDYGGGDYRRGDDHKRRRERDEGVDHGNDEDRHKDKRRRSNEAEDDHGHRHKDDHRRDDNPRRSDHNHEGRHRQERRNHRRQGGGGDDKRERDR